MTAEVSTIRIETTDRDGKPNGYLIPLWNVHEHGWNPEQFYVTVVAPGCSKGPHLHKKRRGRFVCIKGNVEIVTRATSLTSTGRVVNTGFAVLPEVSKYSRQNTGEDHGYALVEVPPGTPAEIRNIGDTEAFVVNMPTPAWHPDDQDEWPVEDWSP